MDFQYEGSRIQATGGDINMTERDFVEVLRNTVRKGRQKNLAEAIGVSPQYLHDVLNERRRAGVKILDYFNMEGKESIVRKAPKGR